MVAEGPYGGHQDHRLGDEARGAGHHVHELLQAEVRGETRLLHHEVRKAQGEEARPQGVRPVGDVAEGPHVNEGGVALGGLHQVGEEGLPEEGGHGPHRHKVLSVDGLALVGEGHPHPAEAPLQVLEVPGQAHEGHDLAGHGELKPPFPGHPVGLAPKAQDDVPEGAVVHVYGPLELYAPGVYAELVPLVKVVVQKGVQEVHGAGDRVEVPGEVEVDLVPGLHAGLPAPRGPALDPEDGPQRGLPQGQGRPLPQAPEGVHEADGRGGFAFPRRRGGDGRDEDQLALGLRGLPQDLGHVGAVEVKPVPVQAELGGHFLYG